VVSADDAARQSEHKDIAHPITAEFREYIQKKVLVAYEDEKKKGPSAKTGAPVAVHVDEDNDIEL
jgi:DNA-binding cell septation regulator SpoVG